MFIYGGLDALRNPGPKVPNAEAVTDELADRIDQLPDDTEALIRANGALQVGAGVCLATNTFARPAAAALAASLVPTTAAGHRFWESDSEATRVQQTIHFLKNVGLLGGLIIAAMDTEGEPGVAWRAQHAIEHSKLLADHQKEVADLTAEVAKAKTESKAAESRVKAAEAAADTRVKAAQTKAAVIATAKQARRDAKLAAKAGRGLSRVVGLAGRTARAAVPPY